MFPDNIKDWASLIAVILSIGAVINSWLTSKSKGNSDQIRGHGDKLVEHDRRIQAIESELKHLPDKDDVNELKLGLAELRGTVGTLNESLSGVSRTVRRVEDYLVKENN